MIYDFTDEKQAEKYLNDLSIEYRFQCYKEKSPEGCQRLGEFLEGMRKDFEKAAVVFKNNCDDNNYGHSCFKYGNYNTMGRGTVRNEEQGLLYYNKGCDLGYSQACRNLGLLYSSSKVGPPQDMKKALEFFQRGCDGDDGHSCFHASGLHIEGKDVPRDMKKAYLYSLQACRLGNIHACTNVGEMYKKGEGVEKNRDMYEQFQKRVKELRKAKSLNT